MIKNSEVNKDNNVETNVQCTACGHTCKQVYIVKNNSIVDMQHYGEPFISTMDKVVYNKDNRAQESTVYMCPNCGILQTEVVKQ